MFASNVYKERREALRRQIGGGLILLLGNGEASTNYPDNTYHFREDSSFLYFFGINHPGFASVIDVEGGEETLFGNDFTMDDIIFLQLCLEPLVDLILCLCTLDQIQPVAARSLTVLGRDDLDPVTILYLIINVY